MESQGIRAKDLAIELKVSQNAVSNMRSSSMPRIDGQKFNDLIIALNNLRKANSDLITPSDLIAFSLSPNEMARLGVNP